MFFGIIRQNGYRLQYLSYFGGNGDDEPVQIACDSENIFILGTTTSTNIQAVNSDMIISTSQYKNFLLAAFSRTGSDSAIGQIEFITMLGGLGNSEANSITLFPNNFIFVSGTTSASNVPLINPLQQYGGGASDILLAAYSYTGSRLWTSYYGGASSDWKATLAADNNRRILYVSGLTNSTNLSTPNAIDSVVDPKGDHIIALLNCNNINSSKTVL